MTAARRAPGRDAGRGAAQSRPARGTTPDTYLTPDELAALLRRTPKTLRSWRYLGKGPAYVRIEGRALYPARAVDAYLAARRVT
ncbi:MAG TPA: helix-turn-helix domain-containing protein [Jatrophihabitans sp.]|nr:helix-turn-helix domain-containing protein [Jatrophihabitans sp.]